MSNSIPAIFGSLKRSRRFEVIVIGGGHAGVEAALASARRGVRTLLLTHNIDTIGQMSCNPAIGGIGKSQLAREIDAMGGVMALAADASATQIRTLNGSKGLAVQATRIQADRLLYKRYIANAVQGQDNLHIFQQEVRELVVHNARIYGVRTITGVEFAAKAVVLTAGTFLAGCIHIGDKKTSAGRGGEPASTRLADCLREINPKRGRLRTGTPPRIDKRSIDFTQLQEQGSDYPLPVFSFMGKVEMHPEQLPCHITATNERTHDIVLKNIDRSAIYGGYAPSKGPRYCPSIETKVERFPHRKSHQVFLEPEGWNSGEYYPNGISTNLPLDIQEEMVRSIPGLENAVLVRPGYAIEYDFYNPCGLSAGLESRHLDGLFMAGQINGTTGYEEAAAQGLVAGINAGAMARELDVWAPRRESSYIGVLIDDLITRGVDEPYRMFTSRSEYRLSLREDNADSRLTPLAFELGLVDDARWRRYQEKRQLIDSERKAIKDLRIHPDSDLSVAVGHKLGIEITRSVTAWELMRRPRIDYQTLAQISDLGLNCDDPEVRLALSAHARYSGYIRRQRTDVERNSRWQGLSLPVDLDYSRIVGLSSEIRQKLGEQKPQYLGQASRIPGVTPAAITLIRVYMVSRQRPEVAWT